LEVLRRRTCAMLNDNVPNPAYASALALTGAIALAAPQAPTMVSVAVTVVSRSGDAPVTGLTAASFRILEDGREQPLASVTEGPGPISLAIVIDSRDTTAGWRQELAHRAVARLASTLKEEDELALVTYEGKIVIAVPWTSPKEFPIPEWSRWKTMPFSEVFQGVYQALGAMNDAKHARTAVVVISDAEQYASKYGLKDFVKSRRESEAAIYGIRTADLLSSAAAIGGPRPGARPVTIWESRGAAVSFDDLVRDSGGRVLPGRTTVEVDRSVDALVAELRNQYVLTFSPSRPFDDSYRRVKVELRNGPHKLRHPLGYLAKAH
jgi:Ca-activated chloride channel family protein